MRRLVGDLNRLYREHPALSRFEFEPRGFRWIDCEDRAHSLLSYLRFSDEETIVVVLNFTPVPRPRHHIGVPLMGTYREIFNSDSQYYGGSASPHTDRWTTHPAATPCWRHGLTADARAFPCSLAARSPKEASGYLPAATSTTTPQSFAADPAQGW